MHDLRSLVSPPSYMSAMYVKMWLMAFTATWVEAHGAPRAYGAGNANADAICDNINTET